MNQDLNTISLILKTNGLTLQSPPEDVRAALTKAGYSDSEITEALSQPAPIEGAAVPATQAVPSEISSVSAPSSPSKSARSGIVVAIVVVLLVAAGGAFAFYEFVPPSPMTILKRALVNSVEAKTVVFSATTTGTTAEGSSGSSNGIGGLGGSLTSSGNFVAGVQGAVDFSSSTAPKFDLNLNGSDASTSTGSLEASAHLIYLNEKVYLNLTDFHFSTPSTDDALASSFASAIINGIASEFENKWMEIDATNTPIAQTTPAMQADYKSLGDYIRGLSYVTSAKNVGTEKINGVDAYHLAITTQGNSQLTELVRKIRADSNPSSATSSEFAQETVAISAALTQPVTADLWVGKKDYRIYKVHTDSFTVPNSTATGTTTITSEDSTFSDYGKPVDIAVPAGAQPIDAALKTMF